MIDSIALSDAATFCGDHSIVDLKLMNYFYGSNAVGKSTIAKIIEDETSHLGCKLNWKNGIKLRTMVYSKTFAYENFSNVGELKGIFTLGKQEIDLEQKIKDAQEAIRNAQNDIANYRKALEGEDGAGGKRGELQTKEDVLKDRCWEVKKKFDAEFREAFEGANSSKDKFKARTLQEKKSNKSTSDKLADIQKRAATVFGPSQSPFENIVALNCNKIINLEKAPILKKKVVGKEDVDISVMINSLGNSDWVQQGRAFFDKNDGTCPFCQQKAKDTLKASFDAYFDKSFETDAAAIRKLESDYKTASDAIHDEVQKMIQLEPGFLKLDALKKERDLLEAVVKVNLVKIGQKKSEPSRQVTLDAISKHTDTINGLIDSANAEIDAHNETVKNLATEKKKLVSQVWRYLLDSELATAITEYEKDKANIDKAIDAIENGIKTKEAMLPKLRKTLQDLEKEVTSVQPAITDINKLLKHFGFQGFSLAAGSEQSTYKIIRPDGSSAKETLSEGEKTFVTFLYFFHLLKGHHTATEVSADRIVVFDDPVSSLDSDILHIVSSLIKSLYTDVRDATAKIKQVFVFTHNTYFHKEVSFFGNKDLRANTFTFWVIRKKGDYWLSCG